MTDNLYNIVSYLPIEDRASKRLPEVSRPVQVHSGQGGCQRCVSGFGLQEIIGALGSCLSATQLVQLIRDI